MVRTFKFLAVMAFSVIAGTSLAYAQAQSNATVAAQTCDAGVWRAMETRARLETEREIMQNQNLIFKPDSILSYTCFDGLAAHVSMYAGPLFTHTNYFGGLVIPWGAPNGMDAAMQSVVVNAMGTYLTRNFNHSMLGGRTEAMGVAGLGNYVTTAVGTQGRSYDCGMMAEVWRTAKCMNFVHVAAFQGDSYHPFISLQSATGGPGVEGYSQINGGEVRQFPATLACTGGNKFLDGNWEQVYRKSRNETNFGVEAGLYAFQTPLGNVFRDVRLRTAPGTCDGVIRTGIKVILTPGANSATYDDGVCTNPGCTYTAAGRCTGAPIIGSTGMQGGGT